MRSILQASAKKRGLVLDPRTKLVLLVTVAVFVLGGAGGEALRWATPCLCAVSLVLLITVGKYKTAVACVALYVVMDTLQQSFGGRTEGIVHFLLLACAGILMRFLPGIVTGAYVVSTTTVSEFSAAMRRMHVGERLVIPLSVMFRFFPTIGDEFSHINAAMRMRGVSFGGGNAAKMIEYRIIPLLFCSVKIGEELSAAALTRGLSADVKRTNVCEIGFHAQDVAVLILCIAPYVCLILNAVGVL